MATPATRSGRPFLIKRTWVWLLATLAIGCELPTRVPNDPTARVVVLPQSVALFPNQSITFMAVGLTSVGDTSQAGVTWSVTGGSMGSESNAGGRHYVLYQAGATPGQYSIAAHAQDGPADTASITVTTASVASVTVAPSSPSIGVGNTVQLTATLKDSAGNTLSGRPVSWASGSAPVASVNSSGLVTGVAAGSATITATSGTVSGSATVTVTTTPAPVASVTVTPGTPSIGVGNTVQLTATLKDSAGNTLSGRPVSWASGSASVATVNSSGLATGVAAGNATITATSGSVSGSASVTVSAPAPVATVTVTPGTPSIGVGNTVQLTATLKDSAGNTLTGRPVSWASGSALVASVNSSGLVTGVAAGSSTITAASGSVSGTATVTVTGPAPVATVTVTPGTPSIGVGKTVQLTATLKDSAGNTLTGRTVTWASGSTLIATVNSSGLVTGVAVGSATITATSGTVSGSTTVTVTPPASVASVTVTPATPSIGVGNTVQLTATLKDSAGNTLTGRTVTWASGSTSIATVNSSGLATGVAAGSSTITAASGLVSGSAIVTVTASSGSGPITDAAAVLTEPTLAKPAALSPIFPSPFNLKVTRIVGDPGSLFTMSAGGSGSWGSDARHHYGDDQPWNADGTLLMLQNSGSPGDVLLDGETYAPYKSGCSDGGYGRWIPTLAHKYERLSNQGGTLFWYDVRTCATTRSWTLPFSATADNEMGASIDGRYIALSDGQRVFVVDMDPQAPFAPYPNQRIGPVYDYSSCGVSSGCTLDWTQVSASGKYVIVHFEGDWQQVLDVDPTTLALSPHAMLSGSYRCHGTAAQGYIEDLGHPDVALNPFDNNEDVVIGQEHCGNIGNTINGQRIGGVMMVRLRDGAITSLSDPTNEAYPYHISARNLDRPGWVYVTYWPSSGQRFDDELVAYKLDGSGAVERYAHSHSNSSGCYRCEPHGVPARDGRRILWASTWTINGTGGSSSVTQAYIVDVR